MRAPQSGHAVSALPQLEQNGASGSGRGPQSGQVTTAARIDATSCSASAARSRVDVGGAGDACRPLAAVPALACRRCSTFAARRICLVRRRLGRRRSRDHSLGVPQERGAKLLVVTLAQLADRAVQLEFLQRRGDRRRIRGRRCPRAATRRRPGVRHVARRVVPSSGTGATSSLSRDRRRRSGAAAKAMPPTMRTMPTRKGVMRGRCRLVREGGDVPGWTQGATRRAGGGRAPPRARRAPVAPPPAATLPPRRP